MKSNSSPGEKSDTGPGADQEAKAWRQAQLEQRHLEAYWNMHRLRDALYHRYAVLLKDKVQAQRLLLQQRYDTARAKSENDTKQKQKKLVFSKLQHNDSYLKSLPKTSYHLNQLADCGHLKSHHDLEEFYRCIKYNDHPSQLQKRLQDVRKKMLGKRSAADLTSQFKTSEEHPPTEVRGPKDDICHSRLLEQGSGSGEISTKLIFNGSLEINKTEQMFPKMKVPTFATLQPNFMRNFQSKLPDLIIPEIPQKSRKAEIYLRLLRQMHNICLINMASSQRLLDKDSDWLCWPEERGVQDLVLPDINSKQEKRSQTIQPLLNSSEQPRSVQSEQPSCLQKLSRITSISQQKFKPVIQDTAACCCKTPDPLSIEDVFQQKHVAVIDRGFKLWRNYM